MKEKKEFTPGPWSYIDDDLSRCYWLIDGEQNPAPQSIPPGTNVLAKILPISSGNHHEANAVMMSAAPDLLAAIEMVFDALDDNGDILDIDFDMLRNARNRALGIK